MKRWRRSLIWSGGSKPLDSRGVTFLLEAAEPARVHSIDLDGFAERLRTGHLGLSVGPFDVRISADARALLPHLHALYADHPLLELDRVFSCHLQLRERWRVRPRPGRYVRFTVDGVAPHDDMPAGHSLAVLEWGLNLVIALRSHRYLMLHAAVVERNGYALALPAAPGCGKTTLCAALSHRGWRLLSDEFGLMNPGSLSFVPLPRPMPLKNESIDVIRQFAPEALIGPSIAGTRKGTVAHVKPPAESVRRQQETAEGRWLVFPSWQRDVTLQLHEVPRIDGFAKVATNAFNYEIHGAAGFETVRDLVATSRCFRLTYSNLEEAVEALTAMADEGVARA